MNRPARIFFEVDARDVKPGDLYANGATVTAVKFPTDPGGLFDWDGKPVPHGKVRIECSESFSVTCGIDRQVVVGRVRP